MTKRSETLSMEARNIEAIIGGAIGFIGGIKLINGDLSGFIELAIASVPIADSIFEGRAFKKIINLFTQ